MHIFFCVSKFRSFFRPQRPLSPRASSVSSMSSSAENASATDAQSAVHRFVVDNFDEVLRIVNKVVAPYTFKYSSAADFLPLAQMIVAQTTFTDTSSLSLEILEEALVATHDTRSLISRAMSDHPAIAASFIPPSSTDDKTTTDAAQVDPSATLLECSARFLATLPWFRQHAKEAGVWRSDLDEERLPALASSFLLNRKPTKDRVPLLTEEFTQLLPRLDSTPHEGLSRGAVTAKQHLFPPVRGLEVWRTPDSLDAKARKDWHAHIATIAPMVRCQAAAVRMADYLYAGARTALEAVLHEAQEGNLEEASNVCDNALSALSDIAQVGILDQTDTFNSAWSQILRKFGPLVGAPLTGPQSPDPSLLNATQGDAALRRHKEHKYTTKVTKTPSTFKSPNTSESEVVFPTQTVRWSRSAPNPRLIVPPEILYSCHSCVSSCRLTKRPSFPPAGRERKRLKQLLPTTTTPGPEAPGHPPCTQEPDLHERPAAPTGERQNSIRAKVSDSDHSLLSLRAAGCSQHTIDALELDLVSLTNLTSLPWLPHMEAPLGGRCYTPRQFPRTFAGYEDKSRRQDAYNKILLFSISNNL